MRHQSDWWQTDLKLLFNVLNQVLELKFAKGTGLPLGSISHGRAGWPDWENMVNNVLPTFGRGEFATGCRQEGAMQNRSSGTPMRGTVVAITDKKPCMLKIRQ